MKSAMQAAYGVIASVFVMNKGDKVARHQHPFTHTTGVIEGSTEVEIWNEAHDKFQMTTTSNTFEFQPLIDHEITSLEDGTIIVNIQKGELQVSANQATGGGVMLSDRLTVI